MKLASLMIPFWMGEKHSHTSLGNKLAEVAHPGVRLGDYPIGTNLIGKAVAASAEFWSENPCCSHLSSFEDCCFNEATIRIEISWNRSKMQEGDTEE
jgi:hypothetical protein